MAGRPFRPGTAALRKQFGGQTTQAVAIVMDPGGKELAAGMERWASLVTDFSPVWPHARALIHAHNLRTFESEGGGTGDKKRWAPLTPRYAAVKAREFPGRPLLVRTSALRSALTGSGSGSRIKESKTKLEVGARGRLRVLARYHQFGTRRMVARPPIKFDPSLRNKSSLGFAISQMLQRMVVDARKRALGENSGVMDAAAIERRTGSLRKLSQRRTE